VIAAGARSFTGAGAIALALASCSVASPATEIREVLDRAAPFEVAAGAARIEVIRASYRDVEVAAEGGRAQVLAVVDADGRVRLASGDVALGYVGREAFELARCARARWCPSGAALPALAGVIEALAGVRRGPGRRPVAWQIRVERDRALVGEDAVAAGGSPAPRGALDLVRDGTGWRLAAPPSR
jgi:hypothetical protein